MAKISTSHPVADVLCDIRIKIWEAEEFYFGPSPTLLVVEDLAFPDNLGLILRTADAAGAEAVLLLGEQTDPLHKNCVRAARGAVGRIPLLKCRNFEKFSASLKARGFRIIGATGKAQQEWPHCDMRPPAAILVGNEQEGLSEKALSCCTLPVRIPMAPGQDSLNVAVAAGILLYESMR